MSKHAVITGAADGIGKARAARAHLEVPLDPGLLESAGDELQEPAQETVARARAHARALFTRVLLCPPPRTLMPLSPPAHERGPCLV